MKTFIFLFVIFTLSITPALAQKKVAVVKLLRGDVDLLTLGKTSKLKVDEWVEEGAVVKTSDKSFVKLIFIDKSQMNIGPHSEMKIENFSGKDSGVIDLVKGKIRSQVTKDYLQMEDKNKSKLFIKTANAVMGVRGTDFMITSNGRNSSVVLFEGEVVFNKLDSRGISGSRNLENIVDRGVRMFPGEFSVVERNRQPTVPSLLNIQQREVLEKNDSFDSSRGPNNSEAKVEKSVVPNGLNGSLVSNNADSLKTEVSKIADAGPTPRSEAVANPEGYVKGDKVKPANGSFLHLESGLIVPPAPDSVLDKNTNTYVAGTGNGSVNKIGDWQPPKDHTVNDKGEVFFVESGGKPQKAPEFDPKKPPVLVVDGKPSGNVPGGSGPQLPPQMLPKLPLATGPTPEQRVEQNQPNANTTIRVHTGN